MDKQQTTAKMENKYQILRDKGIELESAVVGKTLEDARAMCEGYRFDYRVTSVDGQACMVTADVRMNRVGFVVQNNIVVAAQVG